MKLNDPGISSVKQLDVMVGSYRAQPTEHNPAAPEGYSDCYQRDHFMRTSFHCPGNNNFSVQVTNKPWPDETTDDDWVSVTSTMTGYVCTDMLFKWFRIKGLTEGQIVYVLSYDPKH